MILKEFRDRGIDIYAKVVDDYDRNFRKKKVLPKNHDLRPYRFCSRDIVFSLQAVRHDRKRNCLEVDVCLIANPPQYYQNNGAKVAMGFLLSEAYKCGGSMEIVFTKNVEGGRVPAYIYDLAFDLDIKIKNVMAGHITPFESRQLYMVITGFSQEAQQKIMQLSVKGEISPERACFLVMGGLWTLAEAESIILSSEHPERLMMSASDPQDRHLYLNDILSARGAILGGALDRKLLRKELIIDGKIIESEDEETDIEINFDPDHYTKLYQANEKTSFPWLINKTEQAFNIDDIFAVMVRARSSSEIQKYFTDDLDCLKSVIRKYQADPIDKNIFLLYPRDFEDVEEKEKNNIIEQVQKLGAQIMISPESVAGLDKEAMRRIETGRMVRHE